MKKREDIKRKKTEGLTEEEINSPDFFVDDFAPAPDSSEKEEVKKPSVTSLALICAAFAAVIVILGIVTSFTSSLGGYKANAVKKEFKGCTKAEYYKTVDNCPVYTAYYGEKLMGLGIYHTVQGFNGKIEILVCIGSSNEIVSVNVISQKESPGLGSKIGSEKFLKQFVGMTSFEEDGLDIISCATMSSNAMFDAVQDVLNLSVNTFSVAKELKIETIGDESSLDDNSSDESEETTGENDDTNDKKSPLSKRKKDDRQLNGKSGKKNTNKGNGNVGVDGTDVTTVYETEQTGNDTTATTTKAAETQKAETTAAPVETTAPIVETTAEVADTTAETTAEPVDSTSEPAESDTGGEG